MPALAHPTLAFVKYWGYLDEKLFLPLNPTVSVALDAFYVRAEAKESRDGKDHVYLDGNELLGEKAKKPLKLLSFLHEHYNVPPLVVHTESNIPMGTGIASSGAAMAAIALAALNYSGVKVNERELSTIARVGSGSAARSVPGHFNEWVYGETHEESYAYVLHEREHWSEFRVVTFIVSREHKKVSSYRGHSLASANPFNVPRVLEAWKHVELAKRAIDKRDIWALGEVVEKDANNLQAVALSSGIIYFLPQSIAIMLKVRELRESGVPAFYTLDAGPTVHVVTLKKYVDEILDAIDWKDAVVSGVGEGVKLE